MAQRSGSRSLAQTRWLGLIVSFAILIGALIMLAPDQRWADAEPQNIDACNPWRRLVMRQTCHAARESVATKRRGGGDHGVGASVSVDADADDLAALSVLASVQSLHEVLTTAWYRLVTGFGDGVDPLRRMLVQIGLGMLLVPASAIGDILQRHNAAPLSARAQARLRQLLSMLPAFVAPFAIAPTWRLLVIVWEIRFRRLASDLADMGATQRLAATELDDLADLIFWRGVARGVGNLLRVALLRPDSFNWGMRLLMDDVRQSVAPLIAAGGGGRGHGLLGGVWRVLSLLLSLILPPCVALVAAASRALASHPPTHLFWRATALAVDSSATDRWLMVLLPSAAIGVRLLLDGAESLLPSTSVGRRRVLAFLQLAIELLFVQQCLYPAFLMVLSPALFAAGFRGTGSMRFHTTLSLPTLPPRSAVLCLGPAILAAAARAAELWRPGVVYLRALARINHDAESIESDRFTDASELSEWDSERSEWEGFGGGLSTSGSSGAGSVGTAEHVEQWAHAIEAQNWWLLGVVHLMRGYHNQLPGSEWTAVRTPSGRRRVVVRHGDDERRGGGRPHMSAEEWARRNVARTLPSELREPASRLVAALAAVLVEGHEAAAVRDATLRVLSELLSTTLSHKLLTRTGRRQLRHGLQDLLTQQAMTRPPAALRLHTAAVERVCEWLHDPAIGLGGVLRPPPSECPPESIQPPLGSEHDVSYSRDVVDLLFGGAATRGATLSLFLGLAGGTFFHLAGLALRVSLDEEEADAGTSGLQVRVAWEAPSAKQRKHGHLGALRIEVEIEQPQQVTVSASAVSIFNATLGSMPLKGPVHLAGTGGRLRAVLVYAFEGGAPLAPCKPSELPEHVQKHGGGVFFSLERLRIEDAGFELDAASSQQLDELLDGSGGLLLALRFSASLLPVVARIYPHAKAAVSAVSNTMSAISSLWRKRDEPGASSSPHSPRTGPGAAPAAETVSGTRMRLSDSMNSLADAVEREDQRAGSGGGGVPRAGVRLVDDILRLIGDAACANNQNGPMLTWGTLQKEAPELTQFLSSAARRQQARDEQRSKAHAARHLRRGSVAVDEGGASPGALPAALARARSYLSMFASAPSASAPTSPTSPSTAGKKEPFDKASASVDTLPSSWRADGATLPAAPLPQPYYPTMGMKVSLVGPPAVKHHRSM